MKESKIYKKMPPKMYQLLFNVWHWWAKKVLRVPFMIEYAPPPDFRMLGITYGWSKDYVERVQRGFRSEQTIQELQMALERANETIVQLSGRRSNRRAINRAAKRVAGKKAKS